MKRPNSVPPVEAVSILKIEEPDRKGSKKEIEKLRDDFKEHGQLVAVILAKLKSVPTYELLSGWKRIEAARLLNWKEIKAVVLPLDTDAGVAIRKDWVKYIEMHQRYELDHYALAEAAIHMEEQWKIKGSEFARQLGFSNGYIYNLMRWFRNVPPQVREAWRKSSPLITQSELERYSNLPKADALAAWETRCRMRAAAFEPFMPNGRKAKKGAPPPLSSEGQKNRPRRASEQEIADLQQALDNAPVIPSVKGLVSNVLRYVLGIDDDVKGLTTFHAELPHDLIDKAVVKAREKEARNNA